MGFPYKFETESEEKDGTFKIRFYHEYDRVQRSLNLSKILINNDTLNNTLELSLCSYGELVKDNDLISTIINHFSDKNKRYQGLFDYNSEAAVLNTDYYEISAEEIRQLVVDFIDTLETVVNIGVKSLNKLKTTLGINEIQKDDLIKNIDSSSRSEFNFFHKDNKETNNQKELILKVQSLLLN